MNVSMDYMMTAYRLELEQLLTRVKRLQIEVRIGRIYPTDSSNAIGSDLENLGRNIQQLTMPKGKYE